MAVPTTYPLTIGLAGDVKATTVGASGLIAPAGLLKMLHASWSGNLEKIESRFMGYLHL